MCGKEIVKVVRKLKPWNICTAAALMWANYLKRFLQFEYFFGIFGNICTPAVTMN